MRCGQREIEKVHSSVGFIFHRIKQPSPLSNYMIFSSPPPSMLLLFGHPVVSDSVTPWTAACQTSLSLTISLSSHLIHWCPLCLLPSIFPSIRDFSNESSVYIRWPKYRSFSFTISPSSEYSGLISLKIEIDLISLLSKGLSGVLSNTSVLYANDSQIHVFIQDLSAEHNTIPSVTHLADGSSIWISQKLI